MLKRSAEKRMGTSYVEVEESGFWMRDSILELWLRLAALHIKEQPHESALEAKTREIRNQWLFCVEGVFQRLCSFRP